MDMGLTKSLRISAVAHGTVVAILLVSPLIFTGFNKAKPAIPVEFTVAVPYVPPEPLVKAAPPARSAPQPEPDEVVVHETPAPSKAKPKPVKQPSKVQRNPAKVTRYETVQSAKPVQSSKQLSQREIRELIAMGAKPGAETVIPGADARSFEVIRRALYNAWVQPTSEEAGAAVVEVEIQLSPEGAVTGWRMVKRSGVGVLDASVARALQGIKHIQGLTPAFIRKHDTVTIAFQVEP